MLKIAIIPSPILMFPYHKYLLKFVIEKLSYHLQSGHFFHFNKPGAGQKISPLLQGRGCDNVPLG